MGGDGDGSVVARGEGGDGVARGGGGPLSLHTLSGGQTWGHRVGLQIHWLPEMLILSFGRKLTQDAVPTLIVSILYQI